MSKKKIIIVQTGEPIASALEKYGDFDELFIRAMKVDPDLIETYRVYQSEDDNVIFPDVDKIAGLIITGSPAMVTEKHSWSEATVEWLKQFLRTDIPAIGICYGHQLLATALGGKVDWNPNGRQIGSVKLKHTEHIYDDPLLASLSNRIDNEVHLLATHMQSVVQLPDEVTLLGATDRDPHHCFRYKENVWGLQFHPEFTSEIIIDYILARAEDIENEGINTEKLIEDIIENDNGSIILQNFRKLCLGY